MIANTEGKERSFLSGESHPGATDDACKDVVARRFEASSIDDVLDQYFGSAYCWWLIRMLFLAPQEEVAPLALSNSIMTQDMRVRHQVARDGLQSEMGTSLASRQPSKDSGSPIETAIPSSALSSPKSTTCHRLPCSTPEHIRQIVVHIGPETGIV